MLGTLGSPAGAGRLCWRRGREAWEVCFSFSLFQLEWAFAAGVSRGAVSVQPPAHQSAVPGFRTRWVLCWVGCWDGVAGTLYASFLPASDVQVSARLRACPQLASLAGHTALQIHNVCKVMNWGL